MDRQISQSEQQKGSWKKYLIGALILCGLVAAFFGFRKLIKKQVELSDVHIVAVERGDIENTLTASGTVVPMYERQINAPVTTEIAEVNLRSGTQVKKGDLILTLDREYTRLEYEKLTDELELKKNNIEKLKLQYDKDLVELDLRDKIKALELDKQRAQVTDQKRLNEVGGATVEEVERAELALKVGQYEKKILENQLTFKKSVNLSEKRNLELEYEIQRKRLQELKRKLSETKVTASQDGVITYINESIGQTVAEGEALVRIADLSQFRIEGRCADRYAQKIHVGQKVNVKIDKSNLVGVIDRILPEVKNNTIRFLVSLEDESTENLRPNMQTEIYIVTEKRDDVLKLKRGQALVGANNQDVFIVRDDVAYRTPIVKGVSNNKYVEIKEGLKEGDRVMISDMEEYKHVDEFMISNK